MSESSGPRAMSFCRRTLHHAFVVLASLSLVLAAELGAQSAADAAPVVAAGDAALLGAALGSGAWTARYYAVTDSGAREIAQLAVSLAATTTEGEPAWLLVQSFSGAMGTGADTSVFLRDGLQPVRHGSANSRRTMQLSFAPGRVTGEVRPTDGEAKVIDHVVDVAVFDGSAIDFVLAALPFASGYTARLPIYIEENGGLTWVGVRVVGETQVESGGGSVRAWELAVTYPFGTGALWIDATARRPLRMETTGPGGNRFRVVY